MSEIEEKRGLFYLGKQFDLAANATGEAFSLDASHLTTHAAILGMTGSGKTGLGITLLEEALLDGVPAIILDPKGDITNLALTFPDLTPQDLSPWIAPEDAQMHEMTPEAYAAQVAASWRDERAKWDITPERVRQCATRPRSASTRRAAMRACRWTCCSRSRLRRASGPVTKKKCASASRVWCRRCWGWPASRPTRCRAASTSCSRISLSRRGRAGQSLDLPTLIGQIQRPPLQRLGVFELDAFFPEKDRIALAGVAQSPHRFAGV